MAQWVLLGTLASCITVPVPVLAALLPIQLPVSASEKAVEDGSGTWFSWGNLDGV